MAQLKSGVTLREGENLVVELEAELYATAGDPISRFLGKITRFIRYWFLGWRQEGYLIITDQRIIEATKEKSCWCFEIGKHIKYVLPASVKEVGFIKGATFFCCCNAFHLYYDAFTQRTTVQLPTDDESEAQALVDKIYDIIKSAQ